VVSERERNGLVTRPLVTSGDKLSESGHSAPISASRFRPFFNAAIREWIEYTVTGEESDEALVRFSWRSMPGGAITEHFHPHQEERFSITSGEAHFTLDGEERVVGSGETLVVPVGVRHAERNPGPEEIRGVVELRPALHTKEMHEAFKALATDDEDHSRPARAARLLLRAERE
jgi:mannose-6-phosphate isomerase-like protein (cupin superfamily)